MVRVYEYIQSGRGVISGWTLDDEPAGKLDLRIRALKKQESVKLALENKFLVGLRGHGGILKMKINGKVALRPLACRGPVNKDEEITFLGPAIEKDDALDEEDIKRAERRRDDPNLAANRREL